jgi:hypothetical protein
MIQKDKTAVMKKNILHFIPGLLTIVFILAATCGYAQKTNTWKGGFPGKKNDWFCPQNWSTYTVPDEFSDVIIPDVSTSSFAPPVIVNSPVEINSLQMLDNASMTIAHDAVLIVYDHIEGVTPSKLNGGGNVIRDQDREPKVAKLYANQ